MLFPPFLEGLQRRREIPPTFPLPLSATGFSLPWSGIYRLAPSERICQAYYFLYLAYFQRVMNTEGQCKRASALQHHTTLARR